MTVEPEGPFSTVPSKGDPGPFEEAYRNLETVIDQLEAGGLGLEASIRLFEKGVSLAARCESIIQEAELRVTRLVEQSSEDPSSDPPVEPVF